MSDPDTPLAPPPPPCWEFADFPSIRPANFFVGMILTADLFHDFALYQSAMVAATAPPPGLRADDRGMIDGKWDTGTGNQFRLSEKRVRTSRGFHLKVLEAGFDVALAGEHRLWFGYDREARPGVHVQRPNEDEASVGKHLPVNLGFIGVRRVEPAGKERGGLFPELAAATASPNWDTLRGRLADLLRFYRETGYSPLPADGNPHPLVLPPDQARVNYPAFLGTQAAGALAALLPLAPTPGLPLVPTAGAVSFAAFREAVAAVVASVTRVPILPRDEANRHYEAAVDADLARVPGRYRDYDTIFARVGGRLPPGTCTRSYVLPVNAVTPKVTQMTILVYPEEAGKGFGGSNALVGTGIGGGGGPLAQRYGVRGYREHQKNGDQKSDVTATGNATEPVLKLVLAADVPDANELNKLFAGL